MNTKSLESNLARTRPLVGRSIGISISESDDLAAYGLTGDAVNAFTVDLARRLIALGATVALGHNWRTGGVMEAVARFAMAFKAQSAAPSHPLIRNYLAAPDEPSWSETDKAELAGIVSVQTVRWADHVNEILPLLSDGLPGSRSIGHFSESPTRQTVRAFNLTALRYVLAQACDLRLVIGGRSTGYQGMAPGIVEEAWWSTYLGKKVVVCTGLGGAAMAIDDPGSLQAKKILKDEAHPLAGDYLEGLQRISETGAITRIASLSTESLLREIVGGFWTIGQELRELRE